MTVLPTFDAIHDRLAAQSTSFTESEALAALWEQGEDGWLREDSRFRPTPWGRWILSDRYLINDLLVRALREGSSELLLTQQLAELSELVGCPTAACPGDPRLRLDGDRVRLAPSELTAEPLLEEAPPLQQFTTHLPVLSLKAAAASEPAGEWGPGAEAEEVSPLGWLRVEGLGRLLNRRMFVAQVTGHSMDDGRTGLRDRAWAVFEFSFFEGVAYDFGAALPIVLVRGEFDDPDTGSYAVKRWDRSDPEIRLISANADKNRFPDIVVSREEADHLRIVATFARALKPSDFARRPRPQRKPGRRVLDGEAGLAEVSCRLDRRMASFFDGAPPETGDEEEQPSTGWRCRLVCLDAESGGPHLEIGPLEGLPPFVKKLRAVGTDWDGVVLAPNARRRPARVAVRPASGPWSWSAVGFEDDAEDLGMARLEHLALPTDGATLFRVDASGVGQLVQGHALSPGQRYRLLMPPASGPSDGEDAPGVPLQDGWRLWDLELESTVPAVLLERLQALGLSVGEPHPRLEWALVPPASWRTTSRGEPFPSFAPACPIAIQAAGLPGPDESPAVLFLRGEEETIRLVLPETTTALLQLDGLPPGRWACALLHPRVEIPPCTLLFEVAEGATKTVSSSWRVLLGETALDSTDHGELDLSDESTAAALLAVEMPPGWPLSVAWRDLVSTPLASLHADEAGDLDLSLALPQIEERVRRQRVGDVILDAAELGQVTIRHRRHSKPQDLRKRLTDLVTSRAATVASKPGTWLILLEPWFKPICGLLGYQIDPLPEDSLPAAEPGLSAWRLVVDERIAGQIKRSSARVLVLTTDLGEALAQQAAWLDAACDVAGVREAIVSDGLQWTLRRKGNPYKRTVWLLTEVVEAPLSLELMLAELAEGM